MNREREGLKITQFYVKEDRIRIHRIEGLAGWIRIRNPANPVNPVNPDPPF
jgi:hypothetical protein